MRVYIYYNILFICISINLCNHKERIEHVMPYFSLTRFFDVKAIRIFSMKFRFLCSFYFSFYGADVLLFVVSND